MNWMALVRKIPMSICSRWNQITYGNGTEKFQVFQLTDNLIGRGGRLGVPQNANPSDDSRSQFLRWHPLNSVHRAKATGSVHANHAISGQLTKMLGMILQLSPPSA